MVTGAEKLQPLLVDLATNKLLLPVSGQKAKTSPKLLVLISLPIPVPFVSAPLTWSGVCQAPDGPVPAVDKDGGTIVPDYVDIVFESRSWAMINPHNLLVGVRLAAGERGIKFPGGTEIIRPIGTQLKCVTLNANCGRPSRSIGSPIYCGITVEAVT